VTAATAADSSSRMSCGRCGTRGPQSIAPRAAGALVARMSCDGLRDDFAPLAETRCRRSRHGLTEVRDGRCAGLRPASGVQKLARPTYEAAVGTARRGIGPRGRASRPHRAGRQQRPAAERQATCGRSAASPPAHP
jgi:hypothetical protein